MKKSFLASFLISCMCFALIFFGANKLGISELFVEKGVEANAPEDDEKPVNKEPKMDDSVLVLMMGVDDDLGSGKSALKAEKGHRTDTIMLGKANFKTGEIDILSIPRDTRVNVRGKMDKINHAHSYGGVDLAMETVQEFLGVEVDYYVKVDFKGIQEIVDAIGGVEIDVPVNMNYEDPVAKPPLRIHLKKGLQTLDGKKAHDFLRFRRYPDGDVGRVKAQQYFMKELTKQTLQPGNLFKIDKLIKTYYGYVDTNISLAKMLKYAMSAGKLDIDNIRTEIIPGDGRYINEISYYIYDEEAKDQLVEAMFPEYIK